MGQQLSRRDLAVLNALQRGRDQRDDNERVIDDGRKNRGQWACQTEDVERAKARVDRREQGRDDSEVLRHVVSHREGRERTAGHEQLLANTHDLDELGGAGVEVDHVAGLLGSLGSGVHGHGDVRLGERRRVVGAVAGHGDQVTLTLELADLLEFALGGGLGQEVVNAGLGGDCPRR